MSGQSLLDLIEPPLGFVFARGIWLTHDVSVRAVNERLLPALAGLGTADRSLTRSAPGYIEPGALTILAAADRIETRGVMPGDAVRIVPVTGRRQHAKVAVLEYRSVSVEDGAAATVIKTVVTSANLTRGGLATNRELVAVEVIDADTDDHVIARPVLDAISSLADSNDLNGANEPVRALVADLRRAVPRALRPASRAIAHSLGAAPPRALTSALPPGPADRVVLVGPAFAADSSDVARLLHDVIGEVTHVDLVVDTECTTAEVAGGAKVMVPSALLAGLRSRAGSVDVHAAPTDDATSRVSRRLHGKTIIGQWGETCEQMLGSANLTMRGLGGTNRELVALVSLTGSDRLDDALTEVDAVRLSVDQLVPVEELGTDLPAHVPVNSCPLVARFVPEEGQHAGMRLINGVLVVEGVGPGATVMINGREHSLVRGRVPITIDVDNVLVVLRVADNELRIVLVLDPPEGQRFWTSVPLDTVPEKVDPLLWLLLRDFERAAEPTVRAGWVTPVRKPGSDGFSLPPNLRLNVLARHHRALRRLDPHGVDDILTKLFTDPTELAVAQTIVMSTLGHPSESSDPPLKALARLIAARPTNRAAV